MGKFVKCFIQVGVNIYIVIIIVFGKVGVAIFFIQEVMVFSNFNDNEVMEFFIGGSFKIWYWAVDELGYLGVGQNDDNVELNYFVNYYQVVFFEKDGVVESICFYQDELIFFMDGNWLLYQLNNKGQIYFNFNFEGVVGGLNGFDYCYDFDVSDEFQVVFFSFLEFVVVMNGIFGLICGIVMNFIDGGFMSYYVGFFIYEILFVIENCLVVWVVQGNDFGLAWYYIFIFIKLGVDEFVFDNLVWLDEFDINGVLDEVNWSYNIGIGSNGWGNGEVQFYIDSLENVIVEDGLLKIIVCCEEFGGLQFIFVWIVFEDKFEFIYGWVDVWVKLLIGGGIWLVIWFLGEDYQINIWLVCGEIDIMEYVGNEQDCIFFFLYFLGNFVGDVVIQFIDLFGVFEDFYIYFVIWIEDFICFLIDDEVYYIFVNNLDLFFNSDFFLILNVVMGGNFGGIIDFVFMEFIMEIDWVWVY